MASIVALLQEKANWVSLGFSYLFFGKVYFQTPMVVHPANCYRRTELILADSTPQTQVYM